MIFHETFLFLWCLSYSSDSIKNLECFSLPHFVHATMLVLLRKEYFYSRLYGMEYCTQPLIIATSSLKMEVHE
jgi:hypothetical protein